MLARDPRSELLGWRALAPREAVVAAGLRADYDAARVAAGVPEGGVDFAYGDAFPHEANMDLIAGVDFTKGCYVGQEVVSRTKHRGLARKRVTPYHVAGAAPAPGVTIRIDKLADATAAGITPVAEGVTLEFDAPAASA